MARLVFQIASELESKGFKEASELVKQMGKSSKDASDQTQVWSEKTQLLQTAYGALVGLGIVEFYKSCVDESIKAEQSTYLLSQRVENAGLSWAKVGEQVKAFTSALASQTRFEDEDVQNALSRMIDRTNDVAKAQTILQDAMGLSIARGIGLAEASDLVGGASIGMSRSTQMLARTLGMVGKDAKDTDLVMTELHKRYGNLAISEDTAEKKLAKFNNSFKEFKKTLGDQFLPVLKEVMDGTLRFGQFADKVFSAVIALVTACWTGWATMGKIIAEVIKGAVDDFNTLLNSVKNVGPLIRDIFTGNWSKLAEDVKNINPFGQFNDHVKTLLSNIKNITREGLSGMADLFIEAKDDFAEAWKIMVRPSIVNEELPKTVETVKKKMRELTDDLLKMQEEFNASSASNDEEALAHKIKALEYEKAIRAEALKDRMLMEGYTVEQVNTMISASNKALTADQKKLAKEYVTKQAEIFFESGKVIGVATAKMLRGEKDAWKDALKTIIDMIATKAMASVQAHAIEGAGVEIATKGFWGGLPGAMASIAWGTAQTGVIAGLAEVAKGAIGSSGGGGATAPSGGGATSPSPILTDTSAMAPAVAGAGAGQQVLIDIRGDFYGDTQYIDKLADRLSEAVENRDVRLVAKQTR